MSRSWCGAKGTDYRTAHLLLLGNSMINPEHAPDTAGRSILVVEDEVLVRLLITDELRDAGLRVVEAGAALEALAYVRADPDIQVVFSDVRMPGPIDGLELMRRIRSEFPHIRIVLASGHLLRGEFDDDVLLLPKPYSILDAVSRIIAMLDRPPGEGMA
jgi:CheY-like chemotaxis protein